MANKSDNIFDPIHQAPMAAIRNRIRLTKDLERTSDKVLIKLHRHLPDNVDTINLVTIMAAVMSNYNVPPALIPYFCAEAGRIYTETICTPKETQNKPIEMIEAEDIEFPSH